MTSATLRASASLGAETIVGPGRSRPSVTIVLPAYNEAARIGPALDELVT